MSVNAACMRNVRGEVVCAQADENVIVSNRLQAPLGNLSSAVVYTGYISTGRKILLYPRTKWH